MVHHGIPCYEMQLGDVCLPPNHPDAINCDDSVVFDTFRRYRSKTRVISEINGLQVAIRTFFKQWTKLVHEKSIINYRRFSAT